MDIDTDDRYPPECVDPSTSATLQGATKEPSLTPATSTGSDMGAKCRSRTKRSAYYSKVKLPALNDSGATTQQQTVDDTAGDSAQERLGNNPSACILEELDVEAVDDSSFVKKWHELGAEPGSDTEVSLPLGGVCPTHDSPESALQRPNNATAGTEQSCTQESFGDHSPIGNDEEAEDHTAPGAELEGSTMHATQGYPLAFCTSSSNNPCTY